VLRLDDTITQANLAIVTKGLDELTARQARLASERDQAEQVAFPATLGARANEPDVARRFGVVTYRYWGTKFCRRSAKTHFFVTSG
jgi:hypothetical protein